jgi:hypothetical protein
MHLYATPLIMHLRHTNEYLSNTNEYLRHTPVIYATELKVKIHHSFQKCFLGHMFNIAKEEPVIFAQKAVNNKLKNHDVNLRTVVHTCIPYTLYSTVHYMEISTVTKSTKDMDLSTEHVLCTK